MSQFGGLSPSDLVRSLLTEPNRPPWTVNVRHRDTPSSRPFSVRYSTHQLSPHPFLPSPSSNDYRRGEEDILKKCLLDTLCEGTSTVLRNLPDFGGVDRCYDDPYGPLPLQQSIPDLPGTRPLEFRNSGRHSYNESLRVFQKDPEPNI